MGEVQEGIRLVIDTNKIIACLLKSGKIRRLVLLPSLELVSPSYAFEEIRAKKEELARKVDSSVLDAALGIIRGKIREIKPERRYLVMAYQVAKMFDLKDAPFIALALEVNTPIWTNDRDLLTHAFLTGSYIALDTIAVEELLKGKEMEKVLKRLKNRLGLK